MYNSEYKQDVWLNENVFKGKKNGVFVDIGAYDGVLDSNSLFFEKELGWSGVCFEPNVDKFDMLANSRKCWSHNVAISNTDEGILEYMKVNSGLAGWGGLVDFIEPEHLERIKVHINEKDIEILKVPVRTLTSILDEMQFPKEIDYMSVDTEGSEFNILECFDFEKYKVHILTVENNWDKPELRTMMDEKGYDFIHRLTIDDVFLRRV